MKAPEDRAFIRTFSIVIFGFAVLTVAILFLAFGLTEDFEPEDVPSKGPLTEKRIAPVGGVRTSEDELAAAAEESPQPQVAAAPAAAAGDESSAEIDGKAIYGSVCAACHNTGAANAPIPGTELMAERAAQGMDVLLDHVINGFNVMPPRGGRMDLSDDEIRAAIEFMLQ
jgi:cytochrome c5